MPATLIFTVSCSACETEFPIDPGKVPAGGVRARCSICGAIFRVEDPSSVARSAERAPPEATADRVGTAAFPEAGPDPDHGPEPWSGVAEDAEPDADVSPEPWTAEAGGVDAATGWPTEPTEPARDDDAADPTPDAWATPAPSEEEGADDGWRVADPGQHPGATVFLDEEPGAGEPGGPPVVGEVDATTSGADAPVSESFDIAPSEAAPPSEQSGSGPADTPPVTEGTEIAASEAAPTPDAWESAPADIPPAPEGAEIAHAEAPPASEPSETSEDVAFDLDDLTEPGAGAPAEGFPPAPEPSMPTVPAPPPEDRPPLPEGFQFGRRDPHEKARRLARVLVSDIITYNPERYLRALESDRLREDFDEEIRKSWTEYVEQVGPDLAQGTGYWRDALNDLLARGREVF